MAIRTYTTELLSSKTTTGEAFSPIIDNLEDISYPAVYFDGINSYIKANTAFDGFISTANIWTVEAWIKPIADDDYYGSNSYVFGFNRSSNGENTFLLGTKGDIYYNAGATPAQITPLPLNTWTHVAITSNTANTQIYYNGVLETSLPLINAALADLECAVGTEFDSSAGGGANNWFHGYVSNFRVSNVIHYSGSTVPSQKLADDFGTQLLTCNSGTIVDNSSYAHTIQTFGNVASTVIGPSLANAVTSYSAYFNSDDSRVNLGYAAIPTSGPFSIECWAYVEDNRVDVRGHRIWSQYINSSDGGRVTLTIGDKDSTPYTNTVSFNRGSSEAITGPLNLTQVGQWVHILVTRDENDVFRLFADGVLLGTLTTTGTISTAGFQIGGSSGQDTWMNKGYVSDLRLVSGSIPTEYQTSSTTTNDVIFTPPTEPVTLDSQGCNREHVAVLTCQYPGDFYTYDYFNNQNTLTVTTSNGSPQMVPFGPYSRSAPTSTYGVFFDGNSDFITLSAGDRYDFGTGDFTFECWINPSSSGGVNMQILTFQQASGSNFFQWFINKSGSNWSQYYGLNGVGNYQMGSHNGVYGVWTHVALTRNGNVLRAFTNGTLIYTNSNFTYSMGSSSQPAFIARDNGAYGNWYFGNMSNMRLLKGASIYRESFTAPTKTLVNIPGYTSLLALQNQTIVDNSSSPATLTAAGTAKVTGKAPNITISTNTTTLSVPASVYFDGSGDYLSTPSSAGLTFGTGDFTIEGWFYAVSSTNNKGLFMLSSTAGGLVSNASNNLAVALDGGSSRYVVYAGNQDLRRSPPGPQLNTWTHFALVRTSGVTKLYIDGTQAGADITDTVNYSASYLAIGGYYSGSFLLNGYISNFRVVKGTAVYTANFTPPTEPLTAIPGTTLLTCQSTTFTDNSDDNLTITANGNSATSGIAPFPIVRTDTEPSVYTGPNYVNSFTSANTDVYLKLHGRNFDPSANVWLDNVPAKSVEVLSDEDLRAVVTLPDRSGQFLLSVENPDGDFSAYPNVNVGAPIQYVDARGGTESVVGNFKVHDFSTASNNYETFTVITGGNVDIIAVGAGGGSGGYDGAVAPVAGGGGAYVLSTVYLNPGAYKVYVGGKGSTGTNNVAGSGGGAGGLNGGGRGGNAGGSGGSGGGGGGGGWSGIRKADPSDTDVVIAGGGAGGGGANEGTANDAGITAGGGTQNAGANGTSYHGGDGTNYSGDGGGHGGGGGGRYGGAGSSSSTTSGGGNFVSASASANTTTVGNNASGTTPGAAISNTLFTGDVNSYGKGSSPNSTNSTDGIVQIRYRDDGAGFANVGIETFTDTFSTDTSGRYDYNSSTASLVKSYNAGGYLVLNGADNHSWSIWRKSDAGKVHPVAGNVEIVMKKTADYPADNSGGIYITDTGAVSFTGGNGYYVPLIGSGYANGNLTKYVNGTATDTVLNPYDYNDQSAYISFIVKYSPTFLDFLVNGTSQANLSVTADTSEFSPNTIGMFQSQFACEITEISVKLLDGWNYITAGGPGTLEYLIVAGGGGGGCANGGGGGGAGGLIYGTAALSSLSGSYTVTVGAGGPGVTSNRGNQGNASSVFSVTATGGGGGGGSDSGTGVISGSTGGSGGGGGSSGSTTGSGAAGTSEQGSAGGNGVSDNSTYREGGGGGGFSATGANGTSSGPGAGGAGSNTYTTWAVATNTGSGGAFAGGGGGGSYKTATGGAGGYGGGGAGGARLGTIAGTNGVANSGGGGGGRGDGVGVAGATGGSGVVIIRYQGSQVATGGNVITSDGYTYHTFTTSGTFTV